MPEQIDDLASFFTFKSVGDPAPKVTWYHEGKSLDQHELCSAYSKDGYHYLVVSDPEFLDGEKIVCKAENSIGFVDCLIKVQQEGMEDNLNLLFMEICIRINILKVRAITKWFATLTG